MRYRSKPVYVEAMTWPELVAFGIAECATRRRADLIVDGMPTSFDFDGWPVTYEGAKRFVITHASGSFSLTPDLVLVSDGERVYPHWAKFFRADFVRAPAKTKA